MRNPRLSTSLVDAARRDATHIRLLDERDERLLRAFSRLQEGREEAALPQLGICSSFSPARVSQGRGR